MTTKLEVKHLYKVFGETPEDAFPLIEKGLDKDAIFEKTGLTVGVKDVSLSINEGEIFVIMGLQNFALMPHQNGGKLIYKPI